MYKAQKEYILKNVGEIKTIKDLKNAIQFVNNEKISQSTKGLRRQGIKALWWDCHNYNKENWSNLEWEMKKIKTEQTKNTIQTHIDKDILNNILKQANTNKQKLFIKFLAETGVRVSEMTNIKIKDCRSNGVNIDIKIKCAKTDVLVYKTISKELFSLIKNEFKGKTYLFETSSFSKYSRCYISDQIRVIGKKLNINISAHTLRAYFITNNINSGKNIIDISRNVGHLNVGSTVQRYYTGV